MSSSNQSEARDEYITYIDGLVEKYHTNNIEKCLTLEGRNFRSIEQDDMDLFEGYLLIDIYDVNALFLAQIDGEWTFVVVKPRRSINRDPNRPWGFSKNRDSILMDVRRSLAEADSKKRKKAA